MSAQPANAGVPRAFLPRVPLRGMSDERLVARLRAGDDAAFEAIFDRHHRAVLAFCRHMLGDHQEGEDAVQYTFIAALRALRADGRDITLRPWLFAIARNRCLSLLRARRHALPLDDAVPSVDGLAAEVERRADLREILADLQRLPRDQHEAVVLTELGALGHEEIAEVLGVRQDKVKALVFQARENLMGWREARGADCRAVREELSTARGAALRRAPLRRHCEVCDGCAAFAEEVRRQRAAMAMILPVTPGIGLKSGVLAAALGGGAAVAGDTAVGGGLLAAIKGLGAKALLAGAVAGGAGTSGYVAVKEVRHGDARVPAAAAAAPAPRRAVTAATSRPVAVTRRTVATAGRATSHVPAAAAKPAPKRELAPPRAARRAHAKPDHARRGDKVHGGRPAVPPGRARKAAPQGGKLAKGRAKAHAKATPPGHARKSEHARAHSKAKDPPSVVAGGTIAAPATGDGKAKHKAPDKIAGTTGGTSTGGG